MRYASPRIIFIPRVPKQLVKRCKGDIVVVVKVIRQVLLVVLPAGSQARAWWCTHWGTNPRMREPRARLRPLRRTSSALLFLGSYNHSQAHLKKVRTFINRFKITTDVYVHPIKVRRAEREPRAVVIRIVVRACKRVVMCACTLTILKYTMLTMISIGILNTVIY